MALEFMQTYEGPQKLQYGKDQESKFTEEEKAGLQEAKDMGYITSQESEFGNTQGTIPKETETVNEKEVIKTDDGKFSIDIKGALSNVGSSVSAFASEVGSNFAAIAQAVPDKIEEISQDPEKKKKWI